MPFCFQWLKLLFVRTCAVCLLSLFALPLAGQQERWEQLNSTARELYQQGKYAEATLVAKESLRLAEASFGPDDPRTATSLNNLALLYRAQGRYAEAEPLLKRSVAIREKALGPDHPLVATVLENYASLLRKTNREAEALKLEARAKAIRAKQDQ